MGKQLQPMDISAPGQNLESYLSSIQNIAILTPEQEKKLAEDLYYKDDLEAARQLVMAHLRFVVHIARGLCRIRIAASRFNSRRECRPHESS